MTLAPGTRLGPYDVTAQLGEGGMGAVYRARDTKLQRDVALKVLLPEVANDPERLARFRREAQTLAALNHPHIGGIHGLEESNGTIALVLELVEGPTLADRIARGPIPVDDALPIAVQIAEALEAAHEQGIIHRDLKPANIKVRDDGTVKVLDFGLAKALDPAAASSVTAMNSPTITSPAMTQAGMILGTAAYMAPEQARGRAVDRRADIWAFGAVLFEMLSGARAFGGEDIADTLALVVRGEPAWESLPPTVPGRVRQALRACLQKDPKQRLGDMQSARLALDGAFETTAATPPPAVMASRERPAWLALAVTALGALAIGGGGAIWLGAARSVDPEPRVFQVETGDGITAPKVSPDGRSVAFVRNDRVVVRELDTGTTRELAGTEGASNPFWSPDGRSIAYFVAGGFEIRALPAGGGASRALVVDSPGKSPHAFAPFGGTWGERGIVFADFSTGLWIVPDGGQPQPFAAVDQATDEVRLAYPSHLPDGRVLAVSIRNVGQPALVAVGEGRRTTLLTLSEGELMWPVLAGSRVVLFERRGANSGIWGIGVSADVSSAQGEPSPVFPDGSSPSVSADNMLVSLSGRRRGDRQLVWVDRQGRTLVEFGKPQSEFNNPDVSPDGITVAVGSGMPTVATAQASTRPRVGSTSAIWLHQAATARRLPLKTPWSTHPAWSPAGDRLAFLGGTADAGGGLFVAAPSGNGDAQMLVKLDTANPGAAWSPDGRSLVYAEGGDLWIIPTVAGAKPQRLLELAGFPAISPDGRLLAYQSGTPGQPEVYLTTFPVPGMVWPVSGDAGRHPRWNPRGGELFFASGPQVEGDPNSSRDVSAVTVGVLPSVTIGTPRVLFNAYALGFRTNIRGARGYDVGPDGERLLVQTTGVSGTATITAIQNVASWMGRPH